MTVADQAPDTVEETAWLGGRIRLMQPVRGYRAGMDAALLAAFTPACAGQAVIEAGCGAGAVMTALAARCPGRRLTGVERDPAMAELARLNLALNGMDGAVVTGDVGQGFRPLGIERADWVVANPPYFDDAGALRAPAPEKAGAWMADDGLGAWTGFMLAAAKDRGGLVMIHRADRLADILRLWGDKAGSFVIKPIHPFADQPAKRVLVRARRSGKASLKIEAPLVLHDRSGVKHTPEAEAVLRGERDLL